MKLSGPPSEQAGCVQAGWLIPFDIFWGCLFLFLFFGDARDIRNPGLDATESDRTINLLAGLLDGAIACTLLGAGGLLLRRKRAVLWQRVAFWALLLRCGLIVTELFLPQEGLGGIARLLTLLTLAVVTAAALAAAVALGGQEKREPPAPGTEEPPGVWPPPPTAGK